MESTLSTHRKIELQSPEDLSYLIANVRRAADDAVNAAFPPVEGVAGQEDELRMRIEQLVNEVIFTAIKKIYNTLSY
jgi:kinetochor protein Mis14/NSL1